MTIITHYIIAVCLTVIRNNSDISNKIFSVCENISLKINWHIGARCKKNKRDNEVSQLGAIVQTVAALQLAECRNDIDNK